MNKNVVIYIISDSLGETASSLVRAGMYQFTLHEEWIIERFPYVTDIDTLKDVLDKARQVNALIMYSLVKKEMVQFIHVYCDEYKLDSTDLLSSIIDNMQNRSGIEPIRQPGLIRQMDVSYFKRVEAIEFAVKYDDGKDPRGILKADIVLLGISRTSKTPLSMYLANKQIKVANIPLVPEVVIPKELYEVDSKRIIGLTNSPEILNKIRSERLKMMGLNPSANYAHLGRILDELEYAEDIMKKLKCPIINVSNKSIEETAGIIQDIMMENGLVTTSQL